MNPRGATMADVSLSPRNKVGLTLAFLLGLIGIPMFLRGAPDPGEIGPPMAVLITESICGMITVVAVTVEVRGAVVKHVGWPGRFAGGSDVGSSFWCFFWGQWLRCCGRCNVT